MLNNFPDNELLEPESMLFELLGNCLDVVLIPAPDPRHSNHCVRAVQYQNCGWYRRFCALYPPNRRTRCSTIIKRPHTIRALEQIIEGKKSGVYVERLLDFIRTENAQLLKKNNLRVLEELDMMPF